MSLPLETSSGEPLATATPANVPVEATKEPDFALSRFQLLPGEIFNIMYRFGLDDGDYTQETTLAPLQNKTLDGIPVSRTLSMKWKVK